MVRRSLLGLLAAGSALGCGGAPGHGVVGFALPPWGDQTAVVVREELAAATGPRPRGGAVEAVVGGTVITGRPADEHVAGAERLVAIPGLVGVVGHGGSRESLTASAVYNEAGVIQIVPTGTSRLLADAGPWTFALAPNDSLEGEFIVRYAVETLAARRIALFYANDEYGLGLREGTRSALAVRDLDVMYQTAVSPATNHDVLVAAMLLRPPPDVVIAATRARSAAGIARALRRRDLAIPVVGGDGALELPLLPEHAGPAIGLLHVVAFWTSADPRPASRAFVERFRATHDFPPHASHAMTYDALHVLIEAIETVGADPKAVRTYLEALGRTRPPYQGVTGPIAFGPGRPARFVMVRIEDGQERPAAGVRDR